MKVFNGRFVFGSPAIRRHGLFPKMKHSKWLSLSVKISETLRDCQGVRKTDPSEANDNDISIGVINFIQH